MSEIKNIGKSIRARLLNVAKKKGVFYQTILTRYFQERLLYRISKTPYRNNFYLKGGLIVSCCPAPEINYLWTISTNTGTTEALL